MQLGRLLIAAVILAGLSGAIWWSNKNDPQPNPQDAVQSGFPDAPPEPKKADTPSVINIHEPDLKQIEVEHRGEPTITAVYEAPGGWRLSAPRMLDADQREIIGIISVSTNLSSQRVVDEKGAADQSNLTAYGLNPPLISLKYSMKNGSAKRLRLGEDTPDGSGTYASVDGDNRLFTIASSQKPYFDKYFGDLREKHLLKFKQDELTKLELNVPGKPPLEFSKSGDQWQLAKPHPMRADGAAVEELLGKLKEAQMEVPSPKDDPKGEAENKTAAAFTGAKPAVTVRLTAASSVVNLEIRKSGVDYLARATGPNTTPGTFKVSAELGPGLSKTLEDFRNKKLFDFGYEDLGKIEIRDKGQMRVIEKTGTKWMSDNREMDSIAVQNLIDKLRDLTASGFGTSSPGAAELDVTVTSKNGPRKETIHIAQDKTSKDKQAFVAQRENDPAYYSLDEASITALREAANGAREAETKGKK